MNRILFFLLLQTLLRVAVLLPLWQTTAALAQEPAFKTVPKAIFVPKAACQPLPDFVAKGVLLDNARPNLPPALFRIRSSERHASAPAGTILAQSTEPLEGRLCWASFVVSDGSLVKVPQLRGLGRDQAARTLASLRLQVNLRDLESNQPEGRVFGQSPAPDTEVTRGTSVTAIVAQAPPVKPPPPPPLPPPPPPVRFACQPLPDFAARGSLFADARAALPAALFRARITERRPSSARAETILAQSTEPLEGRLCWANFAVSDGSLVRVPPLRGLNRDGANQAVGPLGLRISLSDADSEAPAGLVFQQRPDANAEVPRGTLVIAFVAQPPLLTVPPVVGLRIDNAADNALRRLANFRIRQQPGASLRRAGEVIAQDPAAGERRRKGDEVLLTVSDGSLVEVPAVTHRTLAAARAELARAELAATALDQEAEQAPGTVVGQSPRAGTAVARNSSVNLRVSIGLAIPNVLHEPSETARQTLRRFAVAVEPVQAEQAAGEVIAQSPAAGTRAAAGSPVALRVSDGSIVSVPVIQGLSLSQAREALRRAGDLTASVAADRDRPDAVVDAGTPAAGSKVQRGSAVTLAVTLPFPWLLVGSVGGGASVLLGGLLAYRPLRKRAQAARSAQAAAALPLPSASIEFHTAPMTVHQGSATLPTISLRAQLLRGDSRITLAGKAPS